MKSWCHTKEKLRKMPRNKEAGHLTPSLCLNLTPSWCLELSSINILLAQGVIDPWRGLKILCNWNSFKKCCISSALDGTDDEILHQNNCENECNEENDDERHLSYIDDYQ